MALSSSCLPLEIRVGLPVSNDNFYCVCCHGTKIPTNYECCLQLFSQTSFCFSSGLQHNMIHEIRADTFVQLMALRSM